MSEPTNDVPPGQRGDRTLGWGFAGLGLVIGTIAGLSSAELTLTLMGALFALIGGSVGAFVSRVDPSMRGMVGRALLGFSLAMTLGLYLAIFVKVNGILYLGDADGATAAMDQADEERSDASTAERSRRLSALLRSSESEERGRHLAAEVATGRLELGEACEELLAEIE